MRYPVKTSNENWLNKAIELYSSRVSLSLIDDGNFGIKNSKDIKKIFKGLSLKPSLLVAITAYYSIALICTVLLFTFLKHPKTTFLEIGILLLSILICLAIPSYYLWQNKPPKIIIKDDGLEVIFR